MGKLERGLCILYSEGPTSKKRMFIPDVLYSFRTLLFHMSHCTETDTPISNKLTHKQKCLTADLNSKFSSLPFFLSFMSPFFLPLPKEWGSTEASHSQGNAAGRRSLGLWVCGAVCTCCRAPPQLWPLDRCCGKTRSASSGHGRRSWSTEHGQVGSKSHCGAKVKTTDDPWDINDSLSKGLMAIHRLLVRTYTVTYSLMIGLTFSFHHI